MKTVWEHNLVLDVGCNLPSGVLVHAHTPYESKQRVTVVTNRPTGSAGEKLVMLHELNEIEPMWYVTECKKLTFRLIKRCRYCVKYFKLEQEPLLGERYLIRPKFNTARHDAVGVQTIFPEHLQKHQSLIIEYRPAEPDEDHVIADLNGKLVKFAVVRPPMPEELFTHQTCILRERLNKSGNELYIEMSDTPRKGDRFYYYPVQNAQLDCPVAGAVQHYPGTWAFKFDLVNLRSRYGKYSVFGFSYQSNKYVGFFN